MASKIATWIVGSAFSPLLVLVCAVWLEFYGIIAETRFASYMDQGSWRSPGSQYGNAQMGVMVEGFGPVIMVCFAYLVALLVAHARFKQMVHTELGKTKIIVLCTIASLIYIVLHVLVMDNPTMLGGVVAALYFGGLIIWMTHKMGYKMVGLPRRS